MASSHRCASWSITLGALVLLTALLLQAPFGGGPAVAVAKGDRCKVSDLPGFFEPAAGGKIGSDRRTGCKGAKRVARRFAKSCYRAYAGQDGCRVRAPGRWRCHSRMIGPQAGGAPARVKCRARKGKVSFAVGWLPKLDLAPAPAPEREPVRALSPAWNAGSGCIDTMAPGQTLPPPDLAPFEIRIVGNVTVAQGESLQAALISHNVWNVLRSGLAFKPRVDPGRLTIVLTSGAMPDGTLGLVTKTCHDDSYDAALISAAQAPTLRDQVAAHELFHAFSSGRASSPAALQTNWWEEASASWSVAKAGLPEWTLHDNNLQFPNQAIDNFDEYAYQYAMSRFVQFLDDHGFVTAGPAWPLQREVIAKYPNPTAELSERLDAANTDLGEQVAAFWGDRIRDNPLHGPSLEVGANGTRFLEIDPLLVEVPIKAERLHTKMIEFTLDDNVSRVELEFHTPPGGTFWAAVEPNRSQRFVEGDSVAFCVGGGGVDELKWPVTLPVTFTNGNLAPGEVKGTIDVHAQRNAEQCSGGGAPNNRACQVLRDAGVSNIFGDGQYPFSNSITDEDLRAWICFYEGTSTEVNFNLYHYRDLTAKQVRKNVQRQIDSLNLRKTEVGDLGGVGTKNIDGKPADVLVAATGREAIFLIVGPAGEGTRTLKLARKIVGQIE